MKRILLLALIVLLLTACGGGDGDPDDIIEIPERFFATMINAIRINADEYVGRTIRYEGMFRSFYWASTGEHIHWVLRDRVDCCGAHEEGPPGFEVYLGDIEPFAHNAWVEVIGVLEWYEYHDERFIRVVATTIQELEERGAEFVTQ